MDKDTAESLLSLNSQLTTLAEATLGLGELVKLVYERVTEQQLRVKALERLTKPKVVTPKLQPSIFPGDMPRDLNIE